MNHHYRGLFENWEIGLATKVINRFQNQWTCLKLEEFEDLLQECLTYWYFSKEDYNPSAGTNLRTFMSRVLEHKLQRIVEKLTAYKRKIRAKTTSLNNPVSDKDDSITYLEQISEDEDHSLCFLLKTQLKLDLYKAIPTLSSKQQELCHLLGEEGLSIKEASEVLKIPRSTLYEDIKRIRTIFQQEGLHEYL